MSHDHRRLGRELDLFDSDPLIGAGLPFWLPDGAAARHAVESYLRELERRAGYQHVYSPALGKRQLFELSGHWAKFGDDMFPPLPMGEEELVLRPSQCPHHALIFKARQRSYRELPLRVAELGPMFRAERSGVLGGLNRVRAIQLNDSHVFCAEEQVVDEVAGVLRLMREAHEALGVRPSSVRLSLRGAVSAGDDAMWVRSEALLRDALSACGIAYADAPGEAAFYGPKIDVQVVDPQGRESTLATVQVDFHQPERFDLSYVDASGGRSRPVMVHRSLAGSMERLFGHLIEVHDGAFPAWYAPVQVAVLPVGEAGSRPDEAAAAQPPSGAAAGGAAAAQPPGGAAAGGAAAFHRLAVEAGLRAEIRREGSLGARIREARKIPFVAVIGEREQAAGLVSLRRRGGEQLPAMPAADAIALISEAARP